MRSCENCARSGNLLPVTVTGTTPMPVSSRTVVCGARNGSLPFSSTATAVPKSGWPAKGIFRLGEDADPQIG